MTNEEALKFAKEQTYIFGGTMKEFLQFVIDKLERPQGDHISREALKKAIEQYQIQWNKNCETDIAHWDSCEHILALIDNAPTVEEKPFEINVFLENASESTLFDIKKELARILTDRAEREAYEEARREAMRLDDNEDTYKWRGHA